VRRGKTFASILSSISHDRFPAGEAAAKCDPAAFFVFELLWSHGKDQRKRPLLEKAALSKFVRSLNAYNCQHISKGSDLYQFTVRMGLERVLTKRPTSPYVAGRSHYWQKIKDAGRAGAGEKTP
jgi:ATP-dependent DNA ligase